MDLGIKGKVALVTGGSSGLGLGCAKALATEGARVAIASRSPEKIASALGELPDGCVGYQVDLARPEEVKGLMESVFGDLGRVDILVANAGGPKAGGYSSVGIGEYRGAIEQNLLSMVELCNAVLPGMIKAEFGRIIAITSLFVKAPDPGLILSNTARAGLTGYLKSIATEVAAAGITVNSLLPGLHLTERLTALGGDIDALSASVPTKKLGDPESFGQIAAFVASTHAWYINGQAILVDGGILRGLF